MRRSVPSLVVLSTIGVHARFRPFAVIGNFTGDHCDDVLVSTSTGIEQWEEHIDAEPTLGTTILSVTRTYPW